MPELPEVETIKNDLKRQVVGATITEVDTDWPKTVNEPEYELFSSLLPGKKIKDIKRRGKNLIIAVDDSYLWVHFKMTGHMVVAPAKSLNKDKWDVDDPDSPLAERVNQYIHLAFYLDDGRVMALSDLRKFARVALVNEEGLNEILANLGPEPLEDSFTFDVFVARIMKKRGVIKKVLMDQDVIAGIGNIYADEILFEARIAPQRAASELSESELKRLYKSTRDVLKKAVKMRGTSISDYRDASGKKGAYSEARKVYRRTDEPCPNDCGGVVHRVKINGRSSHYCPNCQK